MKTSQAGLAFAVLTCALNANASSRQPSITITTAETAIKLGDPVQLHITLANPTNQTFSVLRSVGGTHGEFFYSFIVHGPGGTLPSFTKRGYAVQMKEAAPISRIRKTVGPGESIGEDVVVSDQIDMKVPGSYTIIATRPDPLDSSIILKSAPLTIAVTE